MAGTRDLCALTDVKAYIPGYATDASTDTVLTDLITSVSTEMQNDMGREVMPIATNPSAKIFDLSYGDVRDRKFVVGDLKNTTGLTVSIAHLDGTAVASLAIADGTIIALPRNRQEWEPYGFVWLPSEKTGAPSLSVGDVATVTGNWGFPAVPGDLKTACIKLVIVRYLRDIAQGGTAFADAVTDAQFNLSAAFASARAAMDLYRMPALSGQLPVGQGWSSGISGAWTG